MAKQSAAPEREGRVIAETSWPWNPPAAGSAIVASQYRLLSRTMGIHEPGVLLEETDELLVHGESDGRIVHVDAGSAACFGTIYENSSEFTVAIAANGLGATRWDGIVVEWDFVNETASVKAVTGTVDEDGPVLTQDLNDKWQALIALVEVAHGATNITSNDVYECRDRWATHHGDEPAGSLLDFAMPQAALPGNYVFCDGTAYDRWHYPKLVRTCIDTTLTYDGTGLSDPDDRTWGYNPTTKKLHVPDLRGRVTMGIDTQDRVGQGTVAGISRLSGANDGRRDLDDEVRYLPDPDPAGGGRYLRGEGNLLTADAFLVSTGNTLGAGNIADFGVKRVGDSPPGYGLQFSVAQAGVQTTRAMKVS